LLSHFAGLSVPYCAVVYTVPSGGIEQLGHASHDDVQCPRAYAVDLALRNLALGMVA